MSTRRRAYHRSHRTKLRRKTRGRQRGGNSLQDLLKAIADKKVENVRSILEANPAISNSTPKLLYKAIESNNSDTVQALIQYGVNVNVMDEEYGATPLLYCIGSGKSPKIFKQLIDAGANVNQGDADGDTPLHLSAAAGYQKYVEELLQRGADPRATNKYGLTPLHLAVSNARPGIGKMLIERGADINARDNSGTPPILVIFDIEEESKLLKVLEMLLGFPALDINAINEEDEGATALITATMNGYLETVKRLLKAGADPNRQMTGGGYTALHVAAIEANAEIFNTLLEAGASPKIHGVNDMTLLASAALGGDVELIKHVLEINPEEHVNTINKNGHTALLYALNRRNFDAALHLMNLGAQSDIPTNDQMTALIVALDANKPDIAKHMLLGVPSKKTPTNTHSNLNPNIPQKYPKADFTIGHNLVGKSALYIAIEKGFQNIVQFMLDGLKMRPLEARQEFLNRQTNEGNTVLFADKLTPELVATLLELGADPAISNKLGNFPFQHAKSPKIREMLAIVLQDPMPTNNNAAKNVTSFWRTSAPIRELPSSSLNANIPRRMRLPRRAEEAVYNDPSLPTGVVTSNVFVPPGARHLMNDPVAP